MLICKNNLQSLKSPVQRTFVDIPHENEQTLNMAFFCTIYFMNFSCWKGKMCPFFCTGQFLYFILDADVEVVFFYFHSSIFLAPDFQI